LRPSALVVMRWSDPRAAVFSPLPPGNMLHAPRAMPIKRVLTLRILGSVASVG